MAIGATHLEVLGTILNLISSLTRTACCGIPISRGPGVCSRFGLQCDFHDPKAVSNKLKADS